MARATRSSTAHVEKHEDENQDPSGTSPPVPTAAVPPPQAAKSSKTLNNNNNKKRKRAQGTDSDDLPSSKQVKANEEEEIPEKGEMESEPGLSLPSAGDLPMTDEDAQKILDILEMYALGPALTPYPSF